MAMPNDQVLNFSNYATAKELFEAIVERFGGNEATKKTQKTLLRQNYENFTTASNESLDHVFSMLQKIISQLAVLKVTIPQEELNMKFLNSLPNEQQTYVVIYQHKPELEKMTLNDLYNLKIAEPKVRKTRGTSSGSGNMAFLSYAKDDNSDEEDDHTYVCTANPRVNTLSTKVSATGSQTSGVGLSDDTIYAFVASKADDANIYNEDLL